MADADLDKLMINYLGDLDAAVRRLELTLQPDIMKAIEEVSDAFRKDSRWDGKCDWYDDDFWLAPNDWLTTGGVDHKCWFELGAGAGDTMDGKGGEDAFWLTRLLGICDGRLGFR